MTTEDWEGINITHILGRLFDILYSMVAFIDNVDNH